MAKLASIVGLAVVATLQAYASPVYAPLKARAEPDPLQAYSVQVAGQTYINKGLVGFGYIPSNATDTVGDTIGGIGSAIVIKPGTWTASDDGTFSGTLVVQPDRGYNVQGTVNYQARIHEYEFVLTPYYADADLSFDDAAQTLQLTYNRTVLHYDRGDVNTTGLDALGVRPAMSGFPEVADADPIMPIASSADPRLSVDAEGLVANADGSYWTSDEYGPYIYRFSAEGDLIQTIQPPDAFLPYNSTGGINFTASVNPTTGRVANQGFEGLSLDISTNTLYALLQTATVQDGGATKTTSRYTRLLAFDVSDLNVRPAVIGEWVVPLPVSNSKGSTRGSSELHFVSQNIFFALARDGKGRGGSSTTSKYKQADLFDISNATDIHNTVFDEAGGAVAPNGVLNSSITPATYVPFVDYINATQLARFGLHNGSPNDTTLIDAKWESLALAPANDPDYPEDYFLFTAADNDFQTTDGMSVGVPYDAGLDEDTQFLVFRLTLPGAETQLY